MLTIQQIQDMKHAIGFSNNKCKGRKYRKYSAYRNYYTTPDIDDSWDTLVELGYAQVRSFPQGVGTNPLVYSVTEEGLSILSKLLEVEIKEEC